MILNTSSPDGDGAWKKLVLPQQAGKETLDKIHVLLYGTCPRAYTLMHESNATLQHSPSGALRSSRGCPSRLVEECEKASSLKAFVGLVLGVNGDNWLSGLYV